MRAIRTRTSTPRAFPLARRRSVTPVRETPSCSAKSCASTSTTSRGVGATSWAICSATASMSSTSNPREAPAAGRKQFDLACDPEN